MKKRFTEAQIVGFLREADAGVAVKEPCRKHGFSEGSYYLWRSKFGGMSVSDAKRRTAGTLRRSTLNRPGVSRSTMAPPTSIESAGAIIGHVALAIHPARAPTIEVS